MFKKILPFLVLIIFVLVWYVWFYEPAHPTSIATSNTQSNLSLYVQPQAGRNPIVDVINNAQKEVLVEIYLLSDRSVINAILSAKERSVAVKIIIECHPFGGGNINSKTKKELEEKKIETKCASDRFALTHEKMVLVDNETVFILSQNLTTTSFDKNREYDILDKNKEDIAEIRKIFFADWENKTFTPTLTNIIESPNNARAGLTDFISSAQREIDIEMEVISDSAIINLLIEKAKSIKVNLLLPTTKQIAANKKEIEGVSVKTISTPYMHAKMILVDGKRAYVGSINLTAASIDENRELGIILSQSDLIENIAGTFESDWNGATIFP